ncbi:DUF3667 domain-containing protein [Hyphococcus sp.]|uniref:DUF3667 domain-containing protein n=1 Tax=Hyphococcus sp. TaxID=2038636 RepID=UPI0035C77199
MSEIDDIDDGDAGGGDGGLPGPSGLTEAAIAAGAACISCGGDARGAYCSSCGQKNDDLRRSSFVLARDFLRDTFGFDSRMWRTLGLLAVSPGRVPKDYAHGRRSRFTPPVRLFLVISFLFFLTIGLTNTLFVGVEVKFRDSDPEQLQSAITSAEEAGVELSEEARTGKCSFQSQLRFFVKEKNLRIDRERINACLGDVRDDAQEVIDASEDVAVGEDEGIETEREQAGEVVGRVFKGINWAVTNPREFNDSFNDWLPRVLFFMTPVLALILGMFLRRGILLFDHLVLSFYTHAAGFAAIGLSLILAQFGAPYMGAAAAIALPIYYFAVLKRAYGRSWIKTIWTALMSGVLYMTVLFSILVTILSNIVWQATA